MYVYIHSSSMIHTTSQHSLIYNRLYSEISVYAANMLYLIVARHTSHPRSGMPVASWCGTIPLAHSVHLVRRTLPYLCSNLVPGLVPDALAHSLACPKTGL